MERKTRSAGTKSTETRERILDSALKLFRERGFEQATMRQIATESGMALGAAYYYFRSKEALVMAFYERAQSDIQPLLVQALAEHKGLENRLRALLDAKFAYFGPNRSLLKALAAHTDPRHPLSPFSEETRPIRESDIGFFAKAVEGANVSLPKDLDPYLPRILWLYQMGLILFWVYDDSAAQARTIRLTEQSLKIVARLIKVSSLPFMGSVRRQVIDLIQTVQGGGSLASGEE